MIIKCVFKNKYDQYIGREYTYQAGFYATVGDFAAVQTKDGLQKVLVTQIDVPKEEAGEFADILKTANKWEEGEQ